MKRFIQILITILLFVSIHIGVHIDNSKEYTNKLINSLKEDALYYVTYEEDGGCYSLSKYLDDEIKTSNKKYPSKYDLRDKGLVTSVKNQENLGTCWAFGALGASETSILNELKLTNDKYIRKYGNELDLSEMFHVYFALNATYENGKADGFVYKNKDKNTVYKSGGNDFISMSALANLYGPNYESDYPYKKDYVYDGDLRYTHEYQIQDVSFLISPNGIDEDGNYKYIEEGTNSIKEALLNGNAVAICYTFSNPEYTYTYNEVLHDLKDYEGTKQTKELYAKWKANLLNANELELEQLKILLQYKCYLNGYAEDKYDVDNLTNEEIIIILNSRYFGHDYNKIKHDYEANGTRYLMDGETYAHYCDYQTPSDHEVLIVGYDDNYTKEFFQEGHRPPGDGAFIVKGNWGDGWGKDGYFYLSYYDQSISLPTIYNYYIGEEKADEDIELYSYNNMEVQALSSTLFDDKVLCANIYKIENNGTIFSLSTNTANLNVEVEYEVYLLKENYKNPLDGELIYKKKEVYPYGGYHTLDLSEGIDLKQDDIISVVTKQKVNNKYALVVGYGLSEIGLDAIENGIINTINDKPVKYSRACFDNNQSFIKYGDNNWLDWKDEVASIYATCEECEYVTYDNLPIKMILELR